jgi:sulfonate transport system ATP-binding protein
VLGDFLDPDGRIADEERLPPPGALPATVGALPALDRLRMAW